MTVMVVGGNGDLGQFLLDGRLGDCLFADDRLKDYRLGDLGFKDARLRDARLTDLGFKDARLRDARLSCCKSLASQV
jgi:uncharacterized protein YjbI with pentapeptide repeats